MADESAAQPEELTDEPAQAAVAEPTSDTPAEDAADDKPKRGRPRKGAAGKPQGVELVLTVIGSAESTEWTAEVTHGSKRVVKGLAIPASAVSAAAKDLHPEIADAIETVLSAARDRQRTRVEALQAELEAAQRALAELGDNE
jgi:Family of unknown function (DUF6319)